MSDLKVYNELNAGYPTFRENRRSGELFAILSKERMFHLKMGQHGKGDGFEFRIYKTRATVRKYDTNGDFISFQDFRSRLLATFGEYLEELASMLPKELTQEVNNNKLIE